MKAKAPHKGDIRDVIETLTITTDDPQDQVILARFYKAFCRGDHATLQVVAETDANPSELIPA
jgi:hypothetical protein